MFRSASVLRAGPVASFRLLSVSVLALTLAACVATPTQPESRQGSAARPAIGDTSFTIAVIPDTQNYVDYTNQKAAGFAFDASEMFLQQMQFVADNLESAGGDIAFVTAVGDVWQHQTLAMDPAHEALGFKRAPNPILDSMFAPTDKVPGFEMPMAKRGYELIAGKTPFSVVPGNHDYDAMWTDSNHPPKAVVMSAADVGMLHAGGLTNFKTVFSDKSDFFRGKDWYVASNDNGADSAQVFTAGGYRFLHIGLQFNAPDASLAWAASVVRQYPGLPTILSTHDFLDNDGRRLANPVIDQARIHAEDNSAEEVWQKLISQHDQIFLVLSGHHHGQSRRTDPNKFGHQVHQVLSDYQDRHQTAKDAGARLQLGKGIGDGWMRLMTFEMGSEIPRISVRTYSTHYKKESAATQEYASWYKAVEKPKLSDADFLAQDNFTLELPDFKKRFGPACLKQESLKQAQGSC
jgi:hypothetical protein